MMDPHNASNDDGGGDVANDDFANFAKLSALCERLRSERLLISCEHAVLRSMNAKVESQFSEICRLAWICRHEQEILHQLISSSDRSVSPDNCCQLISQLNASAFVEAHKVLHQHAAELVNVYKLLTAAPRAVATFLDTAERISTQYTTEELGLAIFNVLYGSCVFPENEKCVLELLGHLITLQLVHSGDPRKLLRKGNSTFSRMYKCFSEQLFSNKIFLTAALHDPVMFLLSQDELFLDIDPSKSPIRLPSAERARRFGTDENSKAYKEKVGQHRRVIVDKLVMITEKFITSILNAMPSFPRSITWLVRQMYTQLIEKKLISKEEAVLICTELIFTYFLCSAVINPEPLGIISDTPISYIARFNLMQIGQILQTLAIFPCEQRFPAYFGDIFSRLNRESMTVVMNSILNSDSASIETIFPVHVPDSTGAEMLRQPTFIGTLREINILQTYLKSSAIDEISDAALRKNLKNLMKRLPDEFADNPSAMSTPERAPSQSSNRLRSLADKVQNVASRSHQRLMQTSSVSNLRNYAANRSSNSNLASSASSNVLAEEAASTTTTAVVAAAPSFNVPSRPEPFPTTATTTTTIVNSRNQSVLIFPIPEQNELIGMASEEEIMELFRKLQSKRRKTVNGEKKTRFLTATESIVSDRTVTDVASDEDEEEEALDEAAPASSVSSSNDNAVDEEVEDISTLPDNFSDVVPISANVSGRGSPSLSGGRLSGRDTPFSGTAPMEHNVTTEAVTILSTVPAIATQPAEPRRTLPTIPVTVRKQNREGLEEKFGKFGLPPQDPSRYRDETVSLVSDSWSTDVVPSDNEGLSELRSAAEPLSSVAAPPGASGTAPASFSLLAASPSLSAAAAASLAATIPPPILSYQPALATVTTSTTAAVAGQQPSQFQQHGMRQAAVQQQQLQQNTSSTSRHSAHSSQENGPTTSNNNNHLRTSTPHEAMSVADATTAADDEQQQYPYYDPTNLTRCRAFVDAKRKLRLVLSHTTTSLPFCLMTSSSSSTSASSNTETHRQNGISDNKKTISNGTTGIGRNATTTDDGQSAVQQFLKLLLAESINCRDRKQSSQIREVQRCLSIFDAKGTRILLRTMREEHRKRTAYQLYLQQSRLALLHLDFCLEQMSRRLRRFKSLTGDCLIELLVRVRMQKCEQFLRQFVHDFQQLNVQDEKIDLVESHFVHLCEQLVTEPIWRFASLENIEYARKCLERSLMAQIYLFALFPNCDADYYRDEVLYKSIQRLSKSITVEHPELAIPKNLHAECPWPSAQAELSIINAYKSPRDKMACITRCCETIENLIILSSGRTTASADDILPILVFVILKANPSALLSNLQFIDGFYAKRMQGSEAYWWAQTTSAVEHLKTLLNKLCN